MKVLRLLAIATALLSPWRLFAIQQQSEAPKPKGLRISAGVSEGLVTHRVEPEYPEDARAEHVSGEVVLGVFIDPQGKVAAVYPVPREELPPAPAFTDDPRLRAAAIKAVKQWEYRPYLLNGEPIAVETRVVVRFKLESSPPPQPSETSLPPPEPGAAAPQVKRLRVSQGVAQGQLLRMVEPVYPVKAKTSNIQGTVLLKIVIDREGKVAQLEVISGHPLLAAEAVRVVKKWKYKPYLLNGEPVEVESQVDITFRM